MKFVARDVKTTIFCFSSVCVVMRSDLFWPLFFFVISKFLKASLRTLVATGTVCCKNKLMKHIHPK